MSEQIESTQETNLHPTSDERLMAALAHGSVLLSFFGPIGPMLVWVSQRRKSAYASFHALQAMAYQMLFFWVGMALWMLFAIFGICLFLPLVTTLEKNGPNSPMAMLAFQGFFFLPIFLGMGIYFVGGLAGAALCLLNKDVRYPLLGRRLAAFLGFDPASGAPLDEANEDRFVAAMSHASAILLMWGVISPIVVWASQKERSAYLRFQALQASVYQLLAIAGYFGFMAAYFIFTIGMVLLIPLAPLLGRSSGNNAFLGIVLLVFVGLMLVMWAVFMLALPTYHLFSMIASIQILKGKDYRYPILGNFLARRMKNAPPT